MFKIPIYLSAFLLFIGIYRVDAQETAVYKDIQISWQPLENHYQGKEQTLFVIKIENQGKQTLPATGWKIYFNFGRKVIPADDLNQLEFKHVNGGLYYISPGKHFAALKAGEAQQHFISNSWVVNSSDGPHGFYFVWDNKPEVAWPLTEVKKLPPPDEVKMKRFSADRELSSKERYVLNERGRGANIEKQKIFPKPVFYKENNGFFIFDQSVKLSVHQDFNAEAELLIEELNSILGYKIAISLAGKPSAKIELRKDPSIKNGGYKLSITPAKILISANGALEMHYGIQSLKTLIDPSVYNEKLKKKTFQIPAVEVEDYPAFGFRGVMLDVARNFQTKEEVLKLIDLLSLYKLTTLHLHLNDDEGWRLQINALPELTEVGSNRGHDLTEQSSLLPAYGSGAVAGKSAGSGFYSRNDFIEILKYANRRHINVIPEIETPGHARAAIVSMKARYNKYMKIGEPIKASEYLLQDLADSSKYKSVQNWNDHVMDVSMPSVYRFLETVTDEIIDMYKIAGAPLNTIHYGGDEVPAGVWTASPSVKALQKIHPEIKNPADLWDYYFERLSQMISKRNLYLSGWEETALRKSTVVGEKKWQPNPLFLNKNFHVNVWNNMSGNEDLAYRLANSGYKVILSFVTNFYFDMAYVRQFDEPGFNWGGFINLEQSFKFIPIDYLKNQKTDYVNRPLPKSLLTSFQPLTSSGKENILGLQGLLWTETVSSPERLEYMYLPRLLALSERAWSKQPLWAVETDTVKSKSLYEVDWYRFTTAVGREMKRLDSYRGGFQYRIPTPAVSVEQGFVSANTDIPGFQIRYTTDGSIPTDKSALYVKPLPQSSLLKFRTFDGRNRGSKIYSTN